jgi:hypothetical protein
MALTTDFHRQHQHHLAKELMQKDVEYREWLARSGYNPFPEYEKTKDSAASLGTFTEREEHKKARKKGLILLT